MRGEQRRCMWHVQTWVFEGRFEGGVRYDATAVWLLAFWKRPLDKQMRREVASYLLDKRTGGAPKPKSNARGMSS